MFRAVDPCGSLRQEVGPCVDNRVGVAGLLPVLGVVVAVLDAERAEDGTKLSKTVLFATNSDGSLGETTTKLSTLALSLCCLPSLWIPRLLVVSLTVVLEKLFERATATLQAKVFPLDRGIKGTFR